MKPSPVFADTNLFLRYLTNDVPAQADAVEQLLLEAAAGQIALVTNALVIAEIVWTLASFYQQSRHDIRDKVLAILNILKALETGANEYIERQTRSVMNSPSYRTAPHKWGYLPELSPIYRASFGSPAIYRGAEFDLNASF